MYVYYLRNQEVCRSESPVKFTDLFPILKNIEPVQEKINRKIVKQEESENGDNK